MPDYGTFEKMIHWFKTELQTAGQLFQAPGHQRLVFSRPNLTGEQLKQWKNYVAEIYKNIQALIVLRGIYGGTGIEYASFKDIITDAEILRAFESGSSRGVIRLDRAGRFTPNTYSLELRAGTKDAVVQQLDTIIRLTF